MTGRDYPIVAPASVDIDGLLPFDVWKTTLSEYANSPILTKLIANLETYIDPTVNLKSFYSLIWNVDTAEGYGLDVWGRIVGVNRILKISNEDYFGFSEALPGSLGFMTGGASEEGGTFYSGQSVTSNFALADSAYRTLILAKAMSNITDGSIASINRILMSLFHGRGNCYVQDGPDNIEYFGFCEAEDSLGFEFGTFYSNQVIPIMVMKYVFNFALTPVELAVIAQSGVLPRPTGVSATVVIIP